MAKSKKKLYTAIALLAVLAMAGTLAYYFKTMEIDNPFATQKYGGTTVEKFTPEPDWQPGETVDKSVKVENTGDYPLIARVKFEEKWVRKGGTDAYESNASAKGLTAFNPDADAAADVIAPDTVSDVHKTFVNISNTKWKFNTTDGYFYWMAVIPKNGSTEPILQDVTLCNNTNMGKYDVSYEYALVTKGSGEPDADSDAWTTVSGDLPVPTSEQELYQRKIEVLSTADPGHADSTYTLKVITDICQASQAAAAENRWAETIPGLK